MPNSYFITLLKDIHKNISKPSLIPKDNNNSLSPTTKERMRRNKSNDDFMKYQVPWIL